MAKKRYIQAINEALFEEMERDPKVILFGEDVELAIMGDCRGLTEKFGRDRIRNTPICEQTLTGMAVGAAIDDELAISAEDWNRALAAIDVHYRRQHPFYIPRTTGC